MRSKKSIPERKGAIGPVSDWSTPLGLVVASGLLMVACQPPVSLFFFAYVALVPLFFALESDRRYPAFLKGFATGIVCYTGLIYWVVVAMNKYGGISLPLSILTMLLLVVYVAAYLGCFAWAIVFLKKHFSIPIYLTAPPVWILLEYLRGFLLSGFPWSFLSQSQYNFLPLLQIVSITGSYFISLLIVAANCLIYESLRQKRVPVIYGTATVACFAVALIFGVVRMSHPPGPGNIKVSIVQGNIRQDVKFDEAYKNSTVDIYSSLTLKNSPKADLVVWPETAMPFVFLNDEASRVVARLPVRLSNYLLLGTISRDEQRKYYNTAYVIGRAGEIVGCYSKKHLVPFGEYTPLTAYFPFLERISVAAGDFFPGPSHIPIETPVGRLGVFICYEGVFSYITNETVRSGAQALVNITNDAWFGPTSAPYQHFSFYVLRAVETDRYVVRAANTGISAVIDPQGRTVAKTPIFRRAVLDSSFSLNENITFYVRHGDWLILFALLFVAALVIFKAVTTKATN